MKIASLIELLFAQRQYSSEIPARLDHIFEIAAEIVAYFFGHDIWVGYLRLLYTVVNVVLPHLRELFVVFMISVEADFVPDP